MADFSIRLDNLGGHKAMQSHVVVVPETGVGLYACAVFATQESANEYIRQLNAPLATAVPCDVSGGIVGGRVYLAHKYLSESHSHEFVGAFTEYPEARSAVGKDGQVLGKEILL